MINSILQGVGDAIWVLIQIGILVSIFYGAYNSSVQSKIASYWVVILGLVVITVIGILIFTFYDCDGLMENYYGRELAEYVPVECSDSLTPERIADTSRIVFISGVVIILGIISGLSERNKHK